jgi:hypothetical protein
MHRNFAKLFFVSLLSLMILFAGTAFAQDGPPGGGPPLDGPMQGPSPKEAAAAELKNLNKKLKLSEPQKSGIRPILEDEHAEMNALFQDQSGSMEDKMAKMKAIRDESIKKIRDLLTEEQRKQFDKIAEKLGQPGEPPPNSPPGEPPPGGGPPLAAVGSSPGSLRGVVKDPSGAVITGATITAIGGDGKSVTTRSATEAVRRAIQHIQEILRALALKRA